MAILTSTEDLIKNTLKATNDRMEKLEKSMAESVKESVEAPEEEVEEVVEAPKPVAEDSTIIPKNAVVEDVKEELAPVAPVEAEEAPAEKEEEGLSLSEFTEAANNNYFKNYSKLTSPERDNFKTSIARLEHNKGTEADVSTINTILESLDAK